ncbi:MAG: GumC family protein [Candidatus Bipolaricaulota bacterium]
MEPDPYEYEVDLRDYIHVIWKEKWLIVAVFVIAVGAAVGFEAGQPSYYRADASLLLSPDVSERFVGREVRDYVADTFSAEDYQQLATSSAVLERVVEELGLDRGAPKNSGSLENAGSVSVSDEGDKPSVEISLVVEDTDPERAQRAVNKWAEVFVAESEQFVTSELERQEEFLARRLGEVEKDLTQAEQEYKNLLRDYPVKVLSEELSSLTYRYQGTYSDLEGKKASLVEKRSRFQATAETLDETEKLITTRRSPSQESFWNMLVNSESLFGQEFQPEDLNSLSGLSFEEEQLNPLYSSLAEKKGDLSIEVNALQEETGELQEIREEMRERIIDKRLELEEAQPSVDRLESEVSRLRNTHQKLFDQLEDVKLLASESEGRVRILQGATLPQSPIDRNIKTNVAVAAVLGLFLGVLAAFFKHYMEDYQPSEESDSGDED